ncbi:sperm flagellar protein 1-like isoform X2 [Clytia hemisphaerica]|uniref:Calponin-homology (CH) domain-containing protein n=1 Tax=Clytia hemisphaerica TaxID=252671 RepID=A0A7M5V511_9CNID|eukprot:TCONS_00010900-protein
MAEDDVLDEDALQQIYTWIDEVPLSRPKKNIARDFSDGVLIAEIIHHYLPKMVDLHNYSPAHATAKKMDNWNVLGRKCFNKLNFNVKDGLIKGAVFAEPGAVELILRDLRLCIDTYAARKKAQAMMEKHQIHDELSNSTNSYEGTGQYQPGYEGYQYEPQVSTQQEAYHSQQQPPQSNGHSLNEHGPYNYQSQPHAVQSPQKADKPSPQHRKPVTQVSKYSKPKRRDSDNEKGNGQQENLRIALEEKEQALLASQETVQILQAKIRRLEHLLHLKDLRLNEIKKQLPPSAQSQITSAQPQPLHPGAAPMLPGAYRHLHPQQIHPGGPPPSQQFPIRPPLPQIPRPPGNEEYRKYPR